MNIFDNIYGILFRPNETFAHLANKRFFASSFLIIFSLAILNALKNSVAFDTGNGSAWLLLIINTILYLLVWTISGVFITLTADLLGGSGKITDTMIGLAYSTLPLMFIPPLYMLTLAMGDFGENFYSIVKVLILLWVLFLAVLSLKYSHQFHTTQAILSLVSLLFIIILFVVGISTVSFLGTILAISL